MGKPAARMGDTTSHGGSIVVGAPTVLIGGQPAARMNDMHVCPMVNPGVPPPPHVGGPILLGCPTVLICGQMAARMGDMAQCSGPPDSIVGGCPTVLIGEGGGGGGGGGPTGAAASAAIAGKDPDSDDEHFLDVKFTDKKGNPIRGVNYALKTADNKKIKGTIGGQLKKTGVKEGSHEIQLKGITAAEWSVSEAKVGEKVKLSAESFGLESGTKAIISIFLKDSNSSDKLFEVLETKIDSDKIKTEWEFKVDEKLLDIQNTEKKQGGYSLPEYYFVVKADSYSAHSGFLRFKDYIELELKDEDGKAAAGASYKLYLSTGEIREGKLDSSGYVKEENIPPGKVKVSVEIVNE